LPDGVELSEHVSGHFLSFFYGLAHTGETGEGAEIGVGSP